VRLGILWAFVVFEVLLSDFPVFFKDFVEDTSLIWRSLEVAFEVAAPLVEVSIRYELPRILFSVDLAPLPPFLAVPLWPHPIIKKRLRLRKVPNVEFVLGILLDISNSKIKPLLMPSRIRINIHEQVVFLRILVFIHFLNVATFEFGVDEECIGLLHAFLLVVEDFQVFVESLALWNLVRVDAICG